MKFNKITSFVIFFTSLLTFFLLWVFYADKVKDLYVKNILQESENGIVFNETLDLFGRKDLDLSDFWDVYNLMRANYIDIEKVDKKTLEQWAIKWLVESLWDIHSEYLNPEETEQFNSILTWDFEGIWAVVDKIDVWIIVERVLKGSPAKEYWIRNGDIILEANGEELVDLWLYEAVEKIKWPAGSKVLLKILRKWESGFLEIEVVRQKIVIPSIDSYEIEATNDYYIALNRFWDNSSEEFLQALETSRSYSGLIIDLRDNGGWYLQSAVEILSEFIEDGEIIVSTSYKNTLDNFSYKSRNEGDIFDNKIVVLINENSASAAEILAGALSDYNKALLVWKKSYGKWSVQQPFERFSEWGLLKLTIAKWLTPKWRNIDDEWLEPDLEIDFTEEDYELWYDRQLEEAKKLLQHFKGWWQKGLSLDKYFEAQDEGELVN